MSEKVKNISIRIAYLLFIFSFLMPFIDVEGCKTKKVTSYNGYELLLKNDGYLYCIPLFIVFFYLIVSFFKRDFSALLRAFLHTLQAIGIAFSLYMIWIVMQFQFLFDHITPRIGFITTLASSLYIFCYDIFHTKNVITE